MPDKNLAPDGAAVVKGTRYAVTPEWILDHPDLSDRAVRLFGILDRYVGSNTSAWPSRKTLADRLKCSLNTMDRTIKELVDVGAMVIESRRREDGSLTSNNYCLWPLGGTPTGGEGYPHGWGEVAAPVGGGVPPRVGRHEGTPVRSNPNEGKALDQSSASIVPIQTGFSMHPSQQGPATFDGFWAVYPRRVGKLAAEKAWDKAIKTVHPDTIIEGAMAYALDPNREPEFTAHPSTWLNQGRWDDESLPAKVAGVRQDPRRRGGPSLLELRQRAIENERPMIGAPS